MRRVLPFTKIADANPLQLGLIGAQRAKLYQANLPVAPGFILTSQFFKELLVHTDQHAPFMTVAKYGEPDEIHKFITNLKIPQEQQREIMKGVKALNGPISTTTSSSFHDANFELHGIPQEKALDAIKSCWASLFHESRKKHLNKRTFFPAIVVQKDLSAKKSGTVYTHNPVNKSGSRVLIEMHYPDKCMLALKKADGSLLSLKETSGKIPISDQEKDEIVQLAKEAEKFYKSPQKIDWIYGDHLYLTESRSITDEDAKYFFEKAQ